MTAAQHERSASEDVDTVVIGNGDSAVPIDGPIAVYQQGFHWRATLDASPITAYAKDEHASAIRDGQVIARGTVTRVQPFDDGEVVIFVSPRPSRYTS